MDAVLCNRKPFADWHPGSDASKDPFHVAAVGKQPRCECMCPTLRFPYIHSLGVKDLAGGFKSCWEVEECLDTGIPSILSDCDSGPEGRDIICRGCQAPVCRDSLPNRFNNALMDVESPFLSSEKTRKRNVSAEHEKEFLRMSEFSRKIFQ